MANWSVCETGRNMIDETQTGLAGEHSRWWYVTVFILVRSMVSTVLFTSYLLGVAWVGPPIVLLTYFSMVMLLLNPIAIYFDATAINRSGNQWQPNTILYVAGAIVGLIVPLLEFVVSFVYLLRRHRHLGTPQHHSSLTPDMRSYRRESEPYRLKPVGYQHQA